MRPTTLAAALCVLAVPALAQELERPAEWKVRFDQPTASESDLYFVNMPPGWHVTTGPAGILYDPASTASGEYILKAEIYLFPGERREGYGVFFGGTGLDGENQSYTYFLLRKDGRYLIKRREGGSTSDLKPWTEHPAIVRHDGGEDSVKNLLEVAVSTNSVDFYVNGEKLTSLPRSEVATDGVFGLRVNHNLNLHVSELMVTSGG